MRYLIILLILIIIMLGLTGCSSYKNKEYNPWMTVLRITTGNLK
jgi:hypothetical protein